MLVEKNVPLQHCNTFGIAARAETLVRIRSQDDIRQFLADPLWGRQPVFVLGGGSNVVLTGDVATVGQLVAVADKPAAAEPVAAPAATKPARRERPARAPRPAAKPAATAPQAAAR